MNIQNVIESGDFLVLDTETTGLRDAEICQIAIIDSKGDALVNSFVRTASPIPPDATRIHGITNAMIASAPRFSELIDHIADTLAGRHVVVYNAEYDRGMLYQSAAAADCAGKYSWDSLCNWHCAMAAYAPIYGDYNSYYGSYRWQKLTAACDQQGIAVSDAHSALGDCLMTLALCRKLWGNGGGHAA